MIFTTLDSFRWDIHKLLCEKHMLHWIEGSESGCVNVIVEIHSMINDVLTFRSDISSISMKLIDVCICLLNASIEWDVKVYNICIDDATERWHGVKVSSMDIVDLVAVLHYATSEMLVAMELGDGKNTERWLNSLLLCIFSWIRVNGSESPEKLMSDRYSSLSYCIM